MAKVGAERRLAQMQMGALCVSVLGVCTASDLEHRLYEQENGQLANHRLHESCTTRSMFPNKVLWMSFNLSDNKEVDLFLLTVCCEASS